MGNQSFERFGEKLGSLVFATISWVMERRSKFYLRLDSKNRAGCFIECWDRATDGKPIDLDSSLATQIYEAIDYHFGAFDRRKALWGVLEQKILKYRHAIWFMGKYKEWEDERISTFIDTFDLRETIGRYTNIYAFIAYSAAKEIEELERKTSQPLTSDNRKADVNFAGLPQAWTEDTKPRTLRRYISRELNRLKSDLARKNYMKMDFSISDISAVIALSGSLLLFLGYVRIAILGAYYGFSHSDYFSIGDYLATSLDSTGKVLASVAVSSLFALAIISTSNSYSVHEQDNFNKSWSGKVQNFSFWLYPPLALIALGVNYYYSGALEPTMLLVLLIFAGSFFVRRISFAFFLNPLRALMVISTLYISFVTTVAGVVLEINHNNRAPESRPYRVAIFNDGTLSEKEWQFIALASDSIVLKNRESGVLQVRRRADLKQIDFIPRASQSTLSPPARSPA